MSIYIPDASVAVKWFLTEESRDEAIQLLESNTKFVAPDYLKVEFDAVLSKWNRSGRLNFDTSIEIRKLFRRIQIHYVEYSFISQLAFEYSSRIPITHYDALYLVTAKLYESVMITYDWKLANSVRETELQEYVRMLR